MLVSVRKRFGWSFGTLILGSPLLLAHLGLGQALPDPLIFANGNRVETKADWDKRRDEMIASLERIQYGRMPPAPRKWEAEVTETKEGYSGKALERRVTLRFDNGDQSFSMRLGLALPKGNGPFPVIIKNDVAIGHIPLAEQLLDEGYALAEYLRTDLDPDKPGIVGSAQKAYPDFDWATLAVWAWGGMRVIDYLVTLPEIARKQIAVFGHSRGGKVAILIGALDQRVAITLPNGSGAGGAGLYRNQDGKAESLDAITDPKRFAYWFNPRLRQYKDRVADLPFDQHFLRTLIAPRAVLSTDARGDLWANPKGTLEACQAAAPVFAFLEAPKANNACHFREGDHNETKEDWEAIRQFMNRIYFRNK